MRLWAECGSLARRNARESPSPGANVLRLDPMYLLALLAVAVASVFDLKNREIPDSLSLVLLCTSLAAVAAS